MPSDKNITKFNQALNFPVERAVALLKIQTNKAGKFVCPFHQDPTPSMKVVKAKNKCRCSVCGAEASSIELVQKILGYEDQKEAIYFLLEKIDPEKKQTQIKKRSDVFHEKNHDIYTFFHQKFCEELSDERKEQLVKKFKFKEEVLSSRYVVCLKDDLASEIQDFFQVFDYDDLLDSGIVLKKKDEYSLLFDHNDLIFPYTQYLPSPLSDEKNSVILYLEGSSPPFKVTKKVKSPNNHKTFFYHVDPIDWSKKILLCEGAINALGAYCFNKVFTSISVNHWNLSEEQIVFFENADITCSIEHNKSGQGECQQNLTKQYHQLIETLTKKFGTNQNLSFLKNPIGDNLFHYFKHQHRY